MTTEFMYKLYIGRQVEIRKLVWWFNLLIRHHEPLRTFVASLDLETIPVYPSHRSHIQRLYTSLLLHEFLLLFRQLVHY